MKKSEMKLVERTFCDNCGKDISMSNRTNTGDLDFCMKKFMDTGMYCEDVYELMLKRNEQRSREL
jgi:hypothetical protein